MNTEVLGAEALEKLKSAFTSERWARIERQAAMQAADLQALCAKLLGTSAMRHPDNDQAALYSAANRLLLALNSVLKPDDVSRFEDALKSGSNAAQSPVIEAPAMGSPVVEEPAPAKRKPRTAN